MSSILDINSESYIADLLPQIIALAREAGGAIMTIYGEEDHGIEYKANSTPLTRADTVSHNIISTGLVRLSPDWPVLSEESAEIPFEQRRAWQRFWMVDPLDGTKEFLNRNGEFTVNIALIEGNTPILGVVYAPAIDKMYFAFRGSSAYKMERGVTSRISSSVAAGNTIRVMVSRSHDNTLDSFATNIAECEYILMGSSLKFCLVAEGAAHIYPRIGPTMEWDTAAAHCILEAAGGSIADMDGMPLTYNKPQLSSPAFLASCGVSWIASFDRTRGVVWASLRLTVDSDASQCDGPTVSEAI